MGSIGPTAAAAAQLAFIRGLAQIDVEVLEQAKDFFGM